MSRSKRNIVQVGGIIFVGLLTLIFGTATPASATHIQDELAGAGAGQGWEYGNEAVGGPRPATGCEENPLSAELTSRFEIDHQGNYTGVDNPGHPLATPVAYVGPSHVKVQTDRYVASPLGTHDPDSPLDPTGSCLVPVPVPITATVTSPTNLPFPLPDLGSISCSGGPQQGPHNGTFTRIQSAVVIEFTSNCVVRDATGNTAQAVVQHVLEGTMVPCTLAPTTEPNPACLAFEAAFPSEGDASSFYEGTYQAQSVQPVPLP